MATLEDVTRSLTNLRTALEKASQTQSQAQPLQQQQLLLKQGKELLSELNLFINTSLDPTIRSDLLTPSLALSQLVKDWASYAKSLLDELQSLLVVGGDDFNVNAAIPQRRVLMETRLQSLRDHARALRTALRTNAQGEAAVLSTLERQLCQTLDEEGYRFWRSFALDRISVPWTEFVQAITPLLNGPDRDRMLIQLKSTLDPSRSDTVTAFRWKAFLVMFGPGVQTALSRMLETLRTDWFAGFLTYEESVECLRPYARGAFLVRFSQSHAGDFAIAYKSGSGNVNQTIVTATPRGFALDGELFDSLALAVASRPEQLVFPAPSVRAFARLRYFKGLMAFDDAVALLQNRVPGTFLMRFSENEPGALVVAYKEQDGRVAQTKVYPSQGGFRLGNKVYASLDHMIRNWHERFKFPIDEDPNQIGGGLYDRFGAVLGADAAAGGGRAYGLMDLE